MAQNDMPLAEKETKDEENTCPICYDEITQATRAKIIKCNHESCDSCITEYLDARHHSSFAPCPVCRRKTTNIAHRFDSEGNFSKLLNNAKIWSAHLLEVDDRRLIKNDGKFYRAHYSTKLRIMQADGITTFALGRRITLFYDLRLKDASNYRDTKTDPAAERDFQKVTEEIEKVAANIEKNLQLHGLAPLERCFAYHPYEVSPRTSTGTLKHASSGQMSSFSRTVEGKFEDIVIHDHHILHESRRRLFPSGEGDFRWLEKMKSCWEV